MQVEGNRKQTFLGTPAAAFISADAPAPKRTGKSKATTSSSSNGPRWPHTTATHPKLTPDELARAGYYYAPEIASSSAVKGRKTTSRAAKSRSKASTNRARRTKASSTVSDTDPSDSQDSSPEDQAINADDQCCCFTCGKKLGGWDETDDPYEEHWKRSAAVASSGVGKDVDDIACAWATAVCSVVIHVRKSKEGVLKAAKRKAKQPANASSTAAYVYPKSLAHLHPRSDLMTLARQQTYFPSAHLTQQGSREETKTDKGWWPHKVKRAWLCTVPNLAKAGFVYTPTIEDKDCVTCFYCNYSVSDWEPTDDPWKQHYDKSPNCPFFTETVQGQPIDGDLQAETGVDDTIDELADLPTVRSRVAAGSKRPLSKSTLTTTRGRRTTTATISTSTVALDRSTTRSRIPKMAASVTATPSATVRLPKSRTTSDVDDVQDVNETATALGKSATATKARPKRATTAKAPAATTAAKRGTRTTKTTTESTDVLQDDITDGTEVGGDDFDDLPQAGKGKSQSRSKSSKSASTVSASESLETSVGASKAKRAPAARKGVKRTTSAKSAIATETISSATSAVKDTLPSPPPTASETEPETEQDEFDPDERAAYLKDEEDVKSQRLQMVEAGAKEAIAVLQNLGSRRLVTARSPEDEGATPRAASTIKTDSAGIQMDEVMSLTAEEQEMTVIDYVRKMYALRQAALRAAGEAKIQEWQEKAKQARDFIESIPARNQ